MESKLFDLDKLIKFRRNVHQNPELAFEEVETSRKIIEYLKELKVDDSQIRRVAKTGIIVDIRGKAPQSGNPFMVAFRADMDCLPMKETTDVEYKAIREDRAHACGHDGHCAWLLGAASKIMEKIDTIPSDKVVRLLFQPAEEHLGGAFPMIQEGCLKDVNEVYGAHNIPIPRTGIVILGDGPVMSQCTSIEITLLGKGGHGSAPEKAKDPLQAAVDIMVGHRKILEEMSDLVKKKVIVCTLPYLHCGEAPNVIHERAVIKGTLRSFDELATSAFKTKFQSMCEKVAETHGIKLSAKLDTSYPVLVNTKKETEIVASLATEVYGEGRVGPWGLPFLASEDFSYYNRHLPGAFFFVSSGKKDENNKMCHEPDFDFDDAAIEKASELFYRIAMQRLVSK